MSSGFVLVESFANAHEAELMRSVLETNNIAAVIESDHAQTMLSYIGSALSGVRLFVAEEDVERARELIGSSRDEPARSTGAWYCGNCHEEIDPGFEICWSCERPREEVEQPLPPRVTAQAAPEVTDSSDTEPFSVPDSGLANNPYAAPRVANSTAAREQRDEGVDDERDDELDDVLKRAWRAAIIGLWMFPVALHLYSLYLLASAGQRGIRLNSAQARRFYTTFMLDVIGGSLWALALSALLMG